MNIDRILIHGCFPNFSGYAAHTRNFAVELNKFIPVRVRNFAYQKDLSHLTQVQKNMVIYQPNGDMILGKPYDGDIMGDDHTLNIILLEHNHFWYYQKYNGPTFGYCVWESTRMSDQFFNRLLQLDGMFAPTEWQRTCMIDQGYPEDKIWVVPEGVDGSVFYPGKEHEDRFRFLMFGRWDYRKAITENVRAFLEADLDAELILSADNLFSIDGMNSTEERLKHYGLEDPRIKIVHFPPTEEYIKYMKGGNVFLGISRAEGWGLPMIESIASGTPAIMSKHGGQLDYSKGIAHFVNTKEELPVANVFNTSKEDAKQLGNWIEPDWGHAVEVIKDVYDNYKEYKKKAVINSKTIRDKFRWENAAQKAYDIISNINKPKYNIQTTLSETNKIEHFYNEIFNEEVYSVGSCRIELNDVVLDLGGNIGLFSLYAVEKGASEVHSFEPVTEVYNYLEKNTQEFKNIKTYKKAVGSITGKKDIKIFDGDSTSNSLVYNKKYNRVEDIEVININELLKELGHIDFMKMDIEGSEYEVFGAVENNLLNQVDKIIIEYHNSYNNELDIITNKLKECGFDYIVKETDPNYKVGYVVANAIGKVEIVEPAPQISSHSGKMELYQDQWLNGKVVKKGIVDCESRYEALKKIFSKYNRPFTILDIGANFGYYSIRAAEDFDATCIMVESNEGEHEKLLELVEHSKKKDNFTVLNRRISLKDLIELSKCEHFDVVLALNVIHHYPNNINNICDAFMKLGDNLIVETPPTEDEGACGQKHLQIVNDYFSKKEVVKFGSFSRHTSNRKADMMWVKTPKNELIHTYFGWDELFDKVKSELHHLLKKQPLQIHSNLDKKTVYNNRHGVVLDWINGINLKTYMELNGTYPRRKKIVEKLKSKDIITDYKWDNTNTDLVLHNIIINGSKLYLIDYNDKHTNETVNRTDDECIYNIIEIIKGNVVEEESENLVKLNVACGNDIKPGWINVDAYNGSADEKWDVLDLKVEDKSVDKIFASHILEHFSVREVPTALTEWNRVLKVGGKIIIAVPNMIVAVNDWLKSEDKWKSLTNELFGGQDHEGNYHKCGFTKDTLNRIVGAYGFKVDYCDTDPINSSHLLCKATKTNDVKYEDVTINNYFIDGAYLKINGESNKDYSVTFKDGEGNHVHSTILGAGWHTKTNRKYYTDWDVEVSVGNKLIYKHKMNLEGKRVLIELSSKSLGDTLCWVPYVEEFRKKYNCEVFCMTFWNNILDYQNINFIEPGDAYTNIYASYVVGCFDGNTDRNKNNWKTIPLQQIASDYLGLEYKEIRPKLKKFAGKTDMKLKLPKKYVVIAPHSTAQMKYWLNNRWNKVIEYLHKIGYGTVSLSKEPNELSNTIYVTNPSIEDAIRIVKRSKFTMTIGNGISWLSFALKKPNILISGFSEYCEFNESCYRITPQTDCCKGCFNNPDIPFERGIWNYCYNADVLGGKRFECAENISVGMVINKINLLIKENF